MTAVNSKYNLVRLVRMLEDRYSKQPIQPDVFSEYVTLQCWWYLNAAYPIVEMALKLLTGSQERTHDISRLYRQFADQNPIAAGLVEKAVWEYVTFWDVDLKKYPEFESANAFFEAIGDGGQYTKWRYWPIEGGHLNRTWPELFIEIASALGSVLLDKEPYTVSKKVQFHINRALMAPNRWVRTLEEFEVDGSDLISELNEWIWSEGGLENAFEAFLRAGLETKWSQALLCVLEGTRRQLSDSHDPDIKHFAIRPAKTNKSPGGSADLRRPKPEPLQKLPRLLEVVAREPYKLWVRFDDGTSGQIDMEPDGKTIPPAWETPQKWKDVRIKDHAAVWGGWYDACPYSMWQQLVEQG